MRSWSYKYFRRSVFLAVVLLLSLGTNLVFADLYINILAVNGTEKSKDKEIKHYLPKDLKGEDVIDTAGLQIDYDVAEGSYYLFGTVTLQPKETKTYKVRVRDVWKIDPQEVDDIKTQVDSSLERIKNTEFYDSGLLKKQSLIQRLDFIISQQQQSADSVETRIDRFRTYANELKAIRDDGLSVKFWRSNPPTPEQAGVFKYIIEIENPSKDKPGTSEPKQYLPSEVKPEHIVDMQGFEMKYDVLKGQSYLTKKEELNPAEKKRYELSILDVWKIEQSRVDNLKDRARKVYGLLEKTEYKSSADYLVANIKDKLNAIDESQAKQQNIKEHISSFRVNEGRYDLALKDVQKLEELLEAVRESLERSLLKNALQKIKGVKSIADIAESILGTKPSVNNSWKIILGIVIFVAFITGINFMIWGKRSKDAKAKEAGKKEEPPVA